MYTCKYYKRAFLVWEAMALKVILATGHLELICYVVGWILACWAQIGRRMWEGFRAGNRMLVTGEEKKTKWPPPWRMTQLLSYTKSCGEKKSQTGMYARRYQSRKTDACDPRLKRHAHSFQKTLTRFCTWNTDKHTRFKMAFKVACLHGHGVFPGYGWAFPHPYTHVPMWTCKSWLSSTPDQSTRAHCHHTPRRPGTQAN